MSRDSLYANSQTRGPVNHPRERSQRLLIFTAARPCEEVINYLLKGLLNLILRRRARDLAFRFRGAWKLLDYLRINLTVRDGRAQDSLALLSSISLEFRLIYDTICSRAFNQSIDRATAKNRVAIGEVRPPSPDRRGIHRRRESSRGDANNIPRLLGRRMTFERGWRCSRQGNPAGDISRSIDSHGTCT